MKFTYALAMLAFVGGVAHAQQTVTQVRGSPATFSAGTTAPLQSDTHGALHVVADSTSAVTTTPAIVGNGTAATAERVTIASDSTGQVIAAGNVASGATDSGNPVKVGCVYRSTAPTFTDGQRGDCQVGARGAFKVQITGPDVAASISDANGVAVQPGLSASFWNYASGTSPILSNTTTAVTVKTAAGAALRNYIDACQIDSTALGASVPLALRDGAGGTVLWALRPPAAGWLQPMIVRFSPPLKGTANTLVEIATTTADTSGTFDVNCQGHTGS